MYILSYTESTDQSFFCADVVFLHDLLHELIG